MDDHQFNEPEEPAFSDGDDVEVAVPFVYGGIRPGNERGLRRWRKAKITGSTIDPLIYQVQFDGRRMLFIPKRIRAVSP